MLGLYINNKVESSGAGKYTGAPIVLEQFVARMEISLIWHCQMKQIAFLLE